MKNAIKPSAAAITTATSLVGLTEQRASQTKKALKLAKTRFKSAKKALKRARKVSRKAARLARKARRRLDQLQTQILKAKKAAPVQKARRKAKARLSVKPAKSAPGASHPAIPSPAS
jgi:phosphoketolase